VTHSVVLYGIRQCPNLEYIALRGRVTHPELIEALATASFEAFPEELSFEIILKNSLESRKATIYRRSRSEAVVWPRSLPSDFNVVLGRKSATVIFGKYSFTFLFLS